MTDSLRPEEIDEAPSSEPSTIVTSSAPVLPGDPMGIDGGMAMPSPLGPPSVARSPHPPDASSHDVSQPKKPRPKMTLRIPDDEVARPSRPVPSSPSPRPLSVPPPPSAQIKGDRIFNLSIDTPTKQIQVPSSGSSARTPSPAPAAVAEPSARAPVVPARPHSVVPPPTGEDTAPHRAFAAPAPRPHPKDEDSWTPYQPMAVDHEPPPDSASSIDIPIDMGSFDQELAASGDATLASAEALPPRSLPAVAIGPLPPPVPPPLAPAPPLSSSRAPNDLPDPTSLTRTGPNAVAAPPASADPPQLGKTGPNPPAAPPPPPDAPALSRTAPHPGAPPLPPHDPPALSRSGASPSASVPLPPDPTALARSGALPAAPPPPPPSLSRSPPPPEAAPAIAAPAPPSALGALPSGARAPSSTSAPPPSGPTSSPGGPDSFPEMVFDDNLFPTSQRSASDAPARDAIVPAEPRASTETREPDEAPTAPRLPPSSDHAALAPHAPSPPVAVPSAPRSRQGTIRVGEVIEELDIEPAIASEPAEAAEISPEDVVSVEAVPQPRASSPSAPPPPMRPRAASVPSINPAPPVPPAVSKPRMSTPSLSTATVKMSSSAPDLMAAPSTAAPSSPAVTLAPPVPPVPPPKTRPMVIVPGASPLAPPPMSDTTQSRKRARPWWEELFNDDFIRTMAKISDKQIGMEVDFIEESLGLDKGAMVLDLACGTGRHAIELTRRGYQVVGFDLSLAMLAKAADEAQDRDQRINFVQGDMREMTFDGTFDGVYCWSTSFGFFEEEKNAGVIENVRKALKPGGQVLLDVVNRDFVAQECPSLVWFEGDGCVCMDDMTIDWITSRMKVKRTMMMDDGRSREIEYSIRLYSLHELGKLLHDHGFRVAQVSGRIATPGVFFGANSPRTLILAEKK